MSPYREARATQEKLLKPKKNWMLILAIVELATCGLFWTPIPVFVPILLLALLAFAQLVLRTSPVTAARHRARVETRADEILRSYE
jgi:hypothetical protein